MLKKVLNNPKLFLALTIILGLILAVTVTKIVNQKNEMVEVKRAKIGFNKDDELKEESYVKDFVHSNDSYEDAITAADPNLIAKGVIPQGTILRKSMFQSKNQAGIVGLLNNYPGRLAIALKADIENTVGYNLMPGSIVKVSAIYASKGTGTTGHNEDLLDKIPVLKCPNNGGDAPGQQGQSIVLALTADEIRSLDRAESDGATFKVALYGSYDKK